MLLHSAYIIGRIEPATGNHDAKVQGSSELVDMAHGYAEFLGDFGWCQEGGDVVPALVFAFRVHVGISSPAAAKPRRIRSAFIIIG